LAGQGIVVNNQMKVITENGVGVNFNGEKLRQIKKPLL
jgi:hypothetical protein